MLSTSLAVNLSLFSTLQEIIQQRNFWNIWSWMSWPWPGYQTPYTVTPSSRCVFSTFLRYDVLKSIILISYPVLLLEMIYLCIVISNRSMPRWRLSWCDLRTPAVPEQSLGEITRGNLVFHNSIRRFSFSL